MEVGIIKVLETRNEKVDNIEEIEIIEESDNTTKEAETDAELRMRGLSTMSSLQS